MATETAPYFEQITRALGDKVGTEVSEEELREQFDKFLQFGVKPEQAVRSLIRQFGGQAGNPGAAAPAVADGPLKLKDIPPGLSSVDVTVRVVYVSPRDITVRGEPKTIWGGIFGDETGTMPFTSWGEFPHEKGAVLEIKGAYSKEFRGETQLNLGDRVEIGLAPEDALPEYQAVSEERPIGELRAGGGRSVIKGRVLDVERRTVIARGEEKTITTGTLADATGSIPFTAWAEVPLDKGQVVQVDAGYVKEYRGVPQFNFDDAAVITTLDSDTMPPTEELLVTEPIPVGEIIARGGGTNLTIHATLLEVRPGSGLVFRCPECNRVLQSNECRIHGQQEGQADLRIKAIFDDGTGAVNTIINRAETEALYGKSLDEAKTFAEEAMSWDIIEEDIRSKVTGRGFQVTGNALQDDFGIMLLTQRIEPLAVDVKMRAAKLTSEAQALERTLKDLREEVSQ